MQDMSIPLKVCNKYDFIVQQECIPKAIYGSDLLVQSKSGMGKTAIFVLGILNLMDSKPDPESGVAAIILSHTRELAFQIAKEFARFGKYLPEIHSEVLYGGQSIELDKTMLKTKKPHIIIGTPGRVATLVKLKVLDLSKVKYFVIDECDQMIQEVDMRQDIQCIFCKTPHEKQVMMLSATLPKEIRPICRKFLKPVNCNKHSKIDCL